MSRDHAEDVERSRAPQRFFARHEHRGLEESVVPDARIYTLSPSPDEWLTTTIAFRQWRDKYEGASSFLKSLADKHGTEEDGFALTALSESLEKAFHDVLKLIEWVDKAQLDDPVIQARIKAAGNGDREQEGIDTQGGPQPTTVTPNYKI